MSAAPLTADPIDFLIQRGNDSLKSAEALVGLGLVELAKTGRNKAPRVRFEKIALEIAV